MESDKTMPLLVKQSYEGYLHSKKNVNGVGVGYKWVNGKPTDKKAIIVFVEKKLSKNGLISKYSSEELIPPEIDGVPTDIIEIGKITKQSFKTRVRPLKPGYSCGQQQITAGTIGGFFTDKDGDIVILSNNHVLANENKAKIGDLIYQPGPADGITDFAFKGWEQPLNLPYFATLKAFSTINANNNLHDSAIARVHDKIISSGLVDKSYPITNQTISGYNTPSINMQVQKFGRTTGLTTGRIIALNASFTIGYDFGNARFNGCIVFSSMSQGGDSGSIIFDMNMKAVSLLFAGSPKVTIGSPIQPIINYYGLRLPNQVTQSIKLNDGKWEVMTTAGSITSTKDMTRIISPANAYCFYKRPLTNFNSITAVINTGTDKGATWGPGIAVAWPNGIIKINLRYNGSFAGVFNGNANLGIGQVFPNRDYTLRIRKTPTSYVCEVQDTQWYTVLTISANEFQLPPSFLMVGKTNEIGYIGNYQDIGEVGECTIKSLIVT